MCPADHPDRVDGTHVPVDDLAAARDAARLAEARAGELRGELAELQVELLRLRQQLARTPRSFPRRVVDRLRAAARARR